MNNSVIIYAEELSKKWIDRLAEAGIKVIGIHPTGGKEAVTSLTNLLEQLKTPEYRELIDYAHSKGLQVEYEIHACGYLLKRELFDTHPEYFRAGKDGKRINDYNLCASNAEAVGLVAKNAAKLAKQLYGSNNNFYFWLDDGKELSCNCPLCSKLSASEQQLLVLNEMIKEIKKENKDARLAYLAYVDSIVPPKKVIPQKGIFLEYAPFAKYTEKGEDAKELIEHEKEMIMPLMQVFNKEPKKVLEYWYDNSLFSYWKKPPKKFVLKEETMREDIAEYKNFGFDAISTFACFLGKEYEELHGKVDITPFAKAVR